MIHNQIDSNTMIHNQIDSNTIIGNQEFVQCTLSVQLYSYVTSVNLVCVSDKIISNKDNLISE